MAFQISLQPGNEQFIAAADESLLDAALKSGVVLPYGCRGGSCGACRGKLLAGQIDYPHPPDALTQNERDAGQVLLCQARACSDVSVQVDTSALANIAVKALPCRVAAAEKLADDVMRLTLQLPPSEHLDYQPGQYIDILLRNGKQRSFSLATPARRGEPLELHIRAVPGGEFSGQVFNGMQPRSILRLRGPFGAFYLRDALAGESTARPIVMVAGGTGFAPIKAILEALFMVSSTRPVHFYWGARARADLYLNDLVAAWAAQHPQFRYTPVLSDASPADSWQGRTGWVHAAVASDYPDLSDIAVYMSGPPAMIDAGKKAFFSNGLVADHLHYDSFDYAPS